jgi:4-alpha-glucanotransferase
MLPLSFDQMRERTGGAFPQFYPRDDSNWENCEANQREGEEYLRAVVEESRDTRVAGEDLGTVPDYIRPSLRSLGVAGFKIPQWENHPDGRSISGGDYQRLSIATYATHDHKPVRALWEDAFEESSPDSKQARHDLAKIAEFASLPAPGSESDYDRDFYAPIMEALFRCESWVALVMITDLLARKDRFNVPGTAASSNWSRRMGKTVKGLEESRSVRKRMRLIRELLEKTGRLSSRVPPSRDEGSHS